jgi:hypothetical protein
MSVERSYTPRQEELSKKHLSFVFGNDSPQFQMRGGEPGPVGDVELSRQSATAVAELIRACDDERDLFGARLLHAARSVARILLVNASPKARDAFADFALGKTDVLIVRNLVTVPADLEPTPNDREPSIGARAFALANAGLGFVCGHLPIAVSSENQARFDRHVRPTSASMKAKSSVGAAELGPHTEHSYRNHGMDGLVSPQVDMLCLVGLRNDDAETTDFATLQEVIPLMSPASLPVLHEPIFGMDPPDSSEDRATTQSAPILYWRHRQLQCAYRSDKVRIPDRRDARRAIDDLNAAIAKARRSIVLAPGTAWIARNPRCLHWRGEVKNLSRWLVRSFGLSPMSAAVFPAPDRPELVQY